MFLRKNSLSLLCSRNWVELKSSLMGHLGCLCLLKLQRKTGEQIFEKGWVWVRAKEKK